MTAGEHPDRAHPEAEHPDRGSADRVSADRGSVDRGSADREGTVRDRAAHEGRMPGDAPAPVTYEPASERDIAMVSLQLGRPARGVLGIGARCACGNPTVVVTAPRLDDGTPFPTFFYLTHPAATIAMSRLEAEGLMAEWQERLADDDAFAAAYRRAHEAYVAQRDAVERVDEISGVSAGGMPTRVKCLHALAAHALAAGPGVNPVGDLALDASSWGPTVCECAEPGPVGADAPVDEA